MKKTTIAAILALAFMAGCDKPSGRDVIFAGRVEYFYYLDEQDNVSGFTRFEKGLPGTSTMVKEDVFVEVHNDWLVVKLLNRNGASYVVPRERVRSLIVGTKERNELNIPK